MNHKIIHFPTRNHFLGLALAYACFTVYGSLVPLHFQYLPFSDALVRFMNIPYLSLGIGSRADWVSNILLFIPAGFLWSGFFLETQKHGPVGKTVIALSIFVFLTAFSVGIEFIQIWFPPRTVSLNDIAAESIGAMSGIVLWMGLGPCLTRWIRSFGFRNTTGSKLQWVLEAYGIGFLIYCFMPFDLTLSITEIWRKFQQGKIIWLPFGHFRLELQVFYGYFKEMVSFIPVGMLFAVWKIHTITWAVLFVFLVEIGQLFVYSRSSDMTDMVIGIAGMIIGFKIMNKNTRKSDETKIHPVYPWIGLCLLYAFFLIAVFCYPFDVTHDRALIKTRYLEFFRVPFSVLYYGSEYNAISEVLKKGLFFAPLGMGFAKIISMITVSGRVKFFLSFVSMVFSALVALVIEIFQIFMPSKIADFTDIILCLSGSLAGFIIVRYIAGQTGNRHERP